jgi:hypothetical protein
MNLNQMQKQLSLIQDSLRPIPKFPEVRFVNRDVHLIDASVQHVLWVYLEY